MIILVTKKIIYNAKAIEKLPRIEGVKRNTRISSIIRDSSIDLDAKITFLRKGGDSNRIL